MSRSWPTIAGRRDERRGVSRAARTSSRRAGADVERRAASRAARAADDDAARARSARAAAGDRRAPAGCSAIAEQDLRALCLVARDHRRDEPARRRRRRAAGLGGTPIVLAGTDAQRDRWLPDIIEGRSMAGVRDDRAGRRLRCRGAADHARGATATSWVIDGEKHLISNAGLADVYVVFARTSPGPGSRGISAFLVPADAPGFASPARRCSPRRTRSGGCASRTAACRRTRSLGEIDRGFKLGHDDARSAAADGRRRRVRHGGARARRSDSPRARRGGSSASRSATSSSFARSSAAWRPSCAAARLLVYHAAWTKDRGAERITVEAAMAKSYATEAAQRIVDDAVQIVGGVGVVVGHPVERLYRSVRALRIYEGATEMQHLIIAEALLVRRDGTRRDAAARHRVRRRRTRRPVLRPADEEGRPAPPRPGHRAQSRRRHVRLRRRVLRRDDGRHRRGRCRRLRRRSRGISCTGTTSTCTTAARSIRSTGHGFSGISRHTLLRVLQEQAAAAGVELQFESEVSRSTTFAGADLVVGADGANSTCGDCSATASRRRSTCGRTASCGSARPSRFRRSRSISSATNTASGACTPTSTSRAARPSSSSAATRPGAPPGSIARPRQRARRFSSGCSPRSSTAIALITNRSIWRQFPTIVTRPWSVDNVVLIGDAAHTAHFSVGSGTRMAMEDAVALRDALAAELGRTRRDAARPSRARCGVRDGAAAAGREPAARRAGVARMVRGHRALLRPAAAAVRVHAAHAVAAHHARGPAGARSGVSRAGRCARSPTRRRGRQRRAASTAGTRVPPPMFTPFRLRDLVIPNRVVVSPMCQYVADDGTVGDWHLVHLGSRAIGGAGLVMAEMTDVSRDAPHLALVRRTLRAAARRRRGSAIVDFVHRAEPGEDRHPARPRRPQGRDAGVCGKATTSRSRKAAGRWCRRRRFPTSRTAARCRAR